MSYTCKWSGYIQVNTIKRDIIAKISKILAKTLSENFDVTVYDNECTFDIYPDEGGYDSIKVENCLNHIAEYTVDGEIEFFGEDDLIWRFIFKNGKWVEQTACITFSSEATTEKIMSCFRNYLKENSVDIPLDEKLKEKIKELIEGE